MMKKFDVLSAAACAASVVGFILWIISYRTYPAAAVNSGAGTMCALLAAVLLAVSAAKIADERMRGSIVFCAGILLVIFIYQFVMGRVAIAADVYFIPVNHPAEENVAMNISIGGLVASLVSFAAIVANAFSIRD